MSNSLKDQLISLGLGQDKPPGKKPRKPKSRPAGKKPGGDITLDEAWRRRTRTEKEEVENKRRQKREEELKRRQVNARIQPIVEGHKLNDPKAELKRIFMFKGRIRSVLVTSAQLKMLNEGSLGLVFLRGSYYLLEPDVVAQVRAISPDHVPNLNGSDDEDPDHPVPDDLVW